LLKRILLIQDGGFPFGKNDLSIIEWQAIAILKKWEANKNHV